MHILDGLDLEMQADQTEDETLEVLDQVIEDSETFRIPERHRGQIGQEHMGGASMGNTHFD